MKRSPLALSTIRDTAQRVAVSDKYEHLLLYAPGGLSSIGGEKACRTYFCPSTTKLPAVYLVILL